MKAHEPEKRGRPRQAELEVYALKEKLREIALSTDELLNPNKLAKLTGIERRNWSKVEKEIESINNIRSGNITPATAKDYPLPNVEEIFSRFGNNEEKLKSIFQSLINLVSRMWSKSLNYDNTKVEYQIKLSEKNERIDALVDELKRAKEDIEFYKVQYRMVCSESGYRDKRKELGISNNVVSIKKSEKSVMDIDMEELLDDVLLDSKDIATTKTKNIGKKPMK